MNNNYVRICVLTILLSLIYPAQVFAQVTLNSKKQGWYDGTGFNDPTNLNYAVGNSSFGGPWRNFFTFEASNLSGLTVTNATFTIFNPVDGFASYRPAEIFTISPFTGSVSDLISGTGGIQAFDSLASGGLFGSAEISSSFDNGLLQITLNGDFLNFINSAPGLFALGGVMSTLDSVYTADQYAFAFTDDLTPPPQLVLTTTALTTPVPEAGTYGLFGVSALISLAAYRKRRKASPAHI